MNVNIPRSNTDAYYRYKMPVIQIKIEGKGNGIRTVITNMEKIMKALDRPMEYGAKFIGFELGTKYKCDLAQKSCIFAGKHSEETLAVCLDKFIALFVLCVKCKNPETVIQVKHDKIMAKCKACGKTFKMDESHKLSNFIIKNKLTKSIEKVEVKEIKVIDDEKWSLDTSESAVAARKQQLNFEKAEIETKVYPIKNLISYIKLKPTTDEFMKELLELKFQKSWSETVFIKYIFAGLFMDGITDFYNKAKYLQLFVESSKEMMVVLMCIEKYYEEHGGNIVNILNGFYETEILEEDEIFKWYDGKSKIVSETLSSTIRINAKPFIDWLETAEYES